MAVGQLAFQAKETETRHRMNQSWYVYRHTGGRIIPTDFSKWLPLGPCPASLSHFVWFAHSTLVMQILSLSLLRCLSGSSAPTALNVLKNEPSTC